MRQEAMFTRTQCTYTATAQVYDTNSKEVKAVTVQLSSSDERRVEEALKAKGYKLLEILDVNAVWMRYSVPVSEFMKVAEEVGKVEVCEAPPVGRGHKAEKGEA